MDGGGDDVVAPAREVRFSLAERQHPRFLNLSGSPAGGEAAKGAARPLRQAARELSDLTMHSKTLQYDYLRTKGQRFRAKIMRI